MSNFALDVLFPALGERGDNGLIQAAEEGERQDEGEDLGDGVAPPNQIAVAHGHAVAGQDIGDGDEEHQLADDGGDHGIEGLAQSLEGAAQGDAGAGHAEAEGDDAQGGDAHGQQGVAGIEDLQQRAGDGPKQDRAEHHDAGGVQRTTGRRHCADDAVHILQFPCH